MTRDQVDIAIPWIIPWISATGERVDIDISGGGYGYGLYIFRAGDRFRPNGALASLSAFGHLGNGGTCVWADPECEVVGVYLRTCSEIIASRWLLVRLNGIVPLAVEVVTRDVYCQHIESFFPMDGETREVFREWARSRTG
jgi:CubicO group peptidase (beta-lactamase class C family)